jgi:hypothetical protein
MAPVCSNTKKSDSPAAAALTEIARLLARQAARELAEGSPETGTPTSPASLPKKPS